MLKEKMSYSLTKNLLSKSLPKVAYDILNPKPSGTSATMGNVYELVLKNGDTECLNIWTDTKTRGVKFEKWVKENEYEPETCVTEVEYTDCCTFLTAMAQQGVCDVIRGMDYQEHVEGEGWHGYLDFSNSEIIYDLKMTSKGNDWAKTVLNMHYDIQAYLYTLDGRELRWIVVDDSAPFYAFIGEPHCDFIESGKRKYESALPLFEKLNNYQGLGPVESKLVEPPYWLKLQNDRGE